MGFAEDELATVPPPGGTYCPDCDKWVYGDFVAHREAAHPPSTITLKAAGGITSGERFGYQDD